MISQLIDYNAILKLSATRTDLLTTTSVLIQIIFPEFPKETAMNCSMCVNCNKKAGTSKLLTNKINKMNFVVCWCSRA